MWSEIDLHVVRAKSIAMSELMISIIEHRLADSSLLQLASPRIPSDRGSHLALRHPQGYAVMQAMIDRGVIGDFRDPDVMRFGFTPLYTSFVDVWRAASTLVDVIETEVWDQERYRKRAAVT